MDILKDIFNRKLCVNEVSTCENVGNVCDEKCNCWMGYLIARGAISDRGVCDVSSNTFLDAFHDFVNSMGTHLGCVCLCSSGSHLDYKPIFNLCIYVINEVFFSESGLCSCYHNNLHALIKLRKICTFFKCTLF